MTQNILIFLNSILIERLDAKAYEFVQKTQHEIQMQVTDARFTALISLASRFIPKQLLMLTETESARVKMLIAGWNLDSWNILNTVRVSFILARSDLLSSTFADTFNQWFSYADEGELCAYYRAIPLLPESQRLVWRAAEGCRTNMKTIFMAVACDSPFPCIYFDDVAWNQLIVKALVTDTPLARVYGVESRLSHELTHIVLDYMDERSSAGRHIPVDAWLCIGTTNDLRFDQAVETALQSPSLTQQAAAIVALGRAQREKTLQLLLASKIEPPIKNVVQDVLNGKIIQTNFHELVSQFEG